jgi:hypothetical protein
MSDSRIVTVGYRFVTHGSGLVFRYFGPILRL